MIAVGLFPSRCFRPGGWSGACISARYGSPKFPQELRSPAVEALCGGEVMVIVQAEEVGDELRVAHGEPDLPTELLARVYPLPPPVWEAAV